MHRREQEELIPRSGHPIVSLVSNPNHQMALSM